MLDDFDFQTLKLRLISPYTPEHLKEIKDDLLNQQEEIYSKIESAKEKYKPKVF